VTGHLASCATTVTAIDAAPEMIAPAAADHPEMRAAPV
jgi:hypothetical protein